MFTVCLCSSNFPSQKHCYGKECKATREVRGKRFYAFAHMHHICNLVYFFVDRSYVNCVIVCPLPGESGLGKSTLINSLFLTDLYSKDYPGPSQRIKKTVQVRQIYNYIFYQRDFYFLIYAGHITPFLARPSFLWSLDEDSSVPVFLVNQSRLGYCHNKRIKQESGSIFEKMKKIGKQDREEKIG